MSRYVPASLRRLVIERAEGLCEYCLIHEDDTFVGCEIEHVIAEKHGGPTELENLAYACAFCNRSKGTDVASIVPGTTRLVRLFHPRTDRWPDHFRFNGAMLEPTSDVGAVTERTLGMNEPDRVAEREALIAAGRYPSAAALRRAITRT